MKDVDLSHCAPAALRAMAAAGRTVLDGYQRAAQADVHILHPLIGTEPFREDTRYPLPRGARDPVSDARYYLHAHLADEAGHLHTFMGPRGPLGAFKPAPGPLVNTWPRGDEAYTHLVGILLDPYGLPTELFTVNRWVSGEAHYAAADLCAVLPAYSLSSASPPGPTHQVDLWLTALVALFQPHIAGLLHQRDAALAAWQRAHPLADVHEAANLEFPSRMTVDLDDHLEAVNRALTHAGTEAHRTDVSGPEVPTTHGAIG